MTNLQKRILVALIGIPIIVLPIYFGGDLFYLFITLLCIQSYNELLTIQGKKGIKVNKDIAVISIILFLSIFITIFNNGYFINPAYLFFIPFLLFTYILLFVKENPISVFGQIASSFFYPVLPLASLLLFDRHPSWLITPDFLSSKFLFAIFVALWLGDSAAYFTGRAIGKHKLFERISPNKTWEGAISNFIFSIIGFYLGLKVIEVNLDINQNIISGIIIGIFGQVGDLFESYLKRDAGVKDSSNILPGHGGFLDRFDSLIFAGPMVLFYLIIAS